MRLHSRDNHYATVLKSNNTTFALHFSVIATLGVDETYLKSFLENGVNAGISFDIVDTALQNNKMNILIKQDYLVNLKSNIDFKLYKHCDFYLDRLRYEILNK